MSILNLTQKYRTIFVMKWSILHARLLILQFINLKKKTSKAKQKVEQGLETLSYQQICLIITKLNSELLLKVFTENQIQRGGILQNQKRSRKIRKSLPKNKWDPKEQEPNQKIMKLISTSKRDLKRKIKTKLSLFKT